MKNQNLKQLGPNKCKFMRPKFRPISTIVESLLRALIQGHVYASPSSFSLWFWTVSWRKTLPTVISNVSCHGCRCSPIFSITLRFQLDFFFFCFLCFREYSPAIERWNCPLRACLFACFLNFTTTLQLLFRSFPSR